MSENKPLGRIVILNGVPRAGKTSIAFTLAHAPQDIHQFIRLAMGYFALAVLWSTLAYRSGSIVPGMLLHVFGDLAVAYFIVLGGNGSLLFAP